MILELVRAVLVQNYLEVHAEHHAVAVADERYYYVVVFSLVERSVLGRHVHRVISPERSDDVGVERTVGRQLRRGSWELLVVLVLGERYEADIVYVHRLVLLAVERELERKLDRVEVGLVKIVSEVLVSGFRVVGYVNPVVFHLIIVGLRLVLVTYLAGILRLKVGQVEPVVRLDGERQRLVARVVHGQRLCDVGAAVGRKGKSVRVDGNLRASDYGAADCYHALRSVLILDAYVVRYFAFGLGRQGYEDVLSISRLHGEALGNVLGDGHLAAVNGHSGNREVVRSVVAEQHGAARRRCAEHFSEVNRLGVELGYGHKSVAGDVRREHNVLARGHGVVGENSQVVGQLAGIHALDCLRRNGDFLLLAHSDDATCA